MGRWGIPMPQLAISRWGVNSEWAQKMKSRIIYVCIGYQLCWISGCANYWCNSKHMISLSDVL